MPRVIVLPSQEDQMLFEDGKKPENHFDRSFETNRELELYLQGIEAMDDLVDYEIVKESDLSVTAKIGAARHKQTFKTAGEKAAYLQGLEDGDGWRRVQTITEQDFEFEEILELIGDEPAPAP